MIKAGLQQQQKRPKAYILMKMKQFFTQWSLGQRRKKEIEGFFFFFRIQWKWMHSILKFMEHIENRAKRRFHSSKFLHKFERFVPSI
jgi:hypothetical protein